MSQSKFLKNHKLNFESLYAGFFEFAVIAGDMYTSLYSVAASQQSQKSRIERARTLADRLIQANKGLKMVSLTVSLCM